MNFRIFHQKYIKEIQAIGLIFLIVAEMIIFPPASAYAATYNWNQSAWSGGISAAGATHASNQSGWTNYSAADGGISAGANITESVNGVATTSVTTFTATSVFDVGSGIMVAAGAAGSMERSTDSGATWKPLNPVTANAITDITCSSATCYAIGGSGTILKSVDSAATWSVQTSGTTTAMTDISCVDANTCWILNSTNGALLKTADGSTWSGQDTGYQSPVFSDVFFLNANKGWLAGYGSGASNYLETSDGGATWTNHAFVSNVDMGAYGYAVNSISIAFADANTGWMSFNYYYDDYPFGAGSDNAILRTVDGGTTWAPVADANNMGLGEVVPTDSTHASVVFSASNVGASTVYHTANGTSWATTALPAGTVKPVVSCSSATSCITAASGVTNGPSVTTDGWTTLTSHSSPWTGTATRTTGSGFFTSATTGYMVTTGGSIKKTTNNGRTWAAQTSGVATTLNAINCFSASICMAAGAGGVILRTVDGGTNWSSMTSGTTTALYAIESYTQQAWAAVGANGTFLYSYDTGTTWTSASTGTTSAFYGVDCYLKNSGGHDLDLACTTVGASGKIGFFGDGYYYGTGFGLQTSGTTQQLSDVSFVTSDIGFAAGAGGTVRKTVNGGTAWSAANTPTGVTLSTIKCIDANTCYAGAPNSVLYKTMNGGTSWTNLTPFQTTYNIIWENILTGTSAVAIISSSGAITLLSPSYSTSAQTLTSSVYDSGDAGNKVNQITWDEVASGGTTAQFQIRTSNGTATTSYLGPDGTTGTYFSNAAAGCTGTGTITCDVGNVATIGDGVNDRYYQYKVYLVATEAVAPAVDNATVQYVVNVAPNFDSSYDANGVSVSQNATTTSPVGQLVITYKVRDADTTNGSVANRGLVTPSFQYNLNDGAGWQNITSGYLAAGDTDRKAVAEISYNTYIATWDAVSQLGAVVSTTTAQIRVTANDLEGANNTATATETGVTIDTTPPAVSVSFNGPTNTINLTSTDLMSQSMRISNNADSSADGVNGNSGIWVATTSSISWTPPGNLIFYVAVRDQFGNTATTTVTGVASSTAMNIRDVSNPAETNPRLFSSWGVYTNVAGATFSGYKIYRGTSTGAETYLASVSNIAQNYYIDSAVSSTTRYYYKTTVLTTQGNESGYSDELNGIPNGQGFGTDLVSPIISSVIITNVKATTADVTWSTDELSDSYVDFSISPSVAFNNTQSSPSFMTAHSISLTGLSPNTNYLVKVRSSDVYSNHGSSDNGAVGYAFTTTGGPAISAVAVTEVTDRTATITWNTDKDSSSLVFYATNSTLSGAVQAGSTAMVGGAGPVWQHSVTLTGLAQQTKYYFKVRSLDVSDNIGEDTNSGTYHNFSTTLDTAPPTFSNVAPVLTTSDSVVIGWQTNKKSTTQVAYGRVAGVYPSITAVDTSMTINHNAALQGLTESTAYYYVAASVDANGNAATSTEKTFSTTATTVITKSSAYCSISAAAALAEELAVAKDIIPPTVSNVKVEPGSSSAKVTLTASEPASVFVQYGEDIANGYPSMHGSFDYLVSPVLNLSGLKMGTTYHYSIKAKDQAGNTMNTPDAMFVTQYLSEPTTALQTEDQAMFRQKIENIMESALPSLSPPFLSEPRVTSVTSDSAVIEWDTNIAGSSLVAFTPSETFLPAAVNPYIGELGNAQEHVKNHKVELINLDSATTYHAQAVSQGVVGPFGKSVDFTFITKPSVPEVSILEVGPNRISIGWKTNSLTSSFVEYRNLRTGDLRTKGTDDLIREHVVTLEELNPNTRYELKVFGRDTKGNKTESVSRIVSTVVDVTPPKLINVKINNALVLGRTDRLQTIVSWQTDELADSQVFYGEGATVGESLKNKTSLDTVLTTDHTAVISSLKPGTVYRFRVVSVDQVGNKSESPVQVILTPQQAESIIDVISSNLEQSFGWIKLIQK